VRRWDTAGRGATLIACPRSRRSILVRPISSFLLAAGLLSLAAAPVARADDATSAPSMTAPSPMKAAAGSGLAHADSSFMKDAAQAGAAEVETAQLAQSKSNDPNVKAF